MKNYSQYLYFKGEFENPFNSSKDFELNRHMWWHYEQHYHFDRGDQKRFTFVKNFIIWILENKVTYGDPEGNMYRQYKNSSPYSS